MADPLTEPAPKPEPPRNYDCCGGGCADCELRLYGQRLKEWMQLRDARTAAADGTGFDDVCPPGQPRPFNSASIAALAWSISPASRFSALAICLKQFSVRRRSRRLSLSSDWIVAAA